MRIEQASIWEVKADITVITTNSELDSSKRLVMGAGTALQASLIYPSLPRQAGDWILTREKETGRYPERYGWFVLDQPDDPDRRIGFLQTKTLWRHPSTQELVEWSLMRLRYYLSFIEPNLTLPRLKPMGFSFLLTIPLLTRGIAHVLS